MNCTIARKFPCRQITSLALLCAFLGGVLTPPPSGAETPQAISAAQIDKSALAALSRQHLTKPEVISHLDLTKPFRTAVQWTLVVVEDMARPSDAQEDHGPIVVCLVQSATLDCAQHFYEPVPGETPEYPAPYHLFASRVVYAGSDDSGPLLLVQVCTAEMFDGNCGIATVLYRYDSPTNRFVRVFLNVTGRNNNEATRFVETGSLQGDVIVDYPTEHAPYTYWIEIYRAQPSGQYQRILRYRGHTGYSDGNPLAVADSEMPEILRHLGFWKPGDVLPAPAHLPRGCSHLYMRADEEWCK